ncbi:MFS transporter [Mollicutes bacterium LVI A0078]|nr:MFS transporter [Mollicutes bacterium LVI A0078]
MKKILILNFLMLTLFNFAHPVTPQMMELKGSPDYLFGLFFFAMSAGTFYFSPKWGSKIDRIGTRKILTIAPLIYAIGQFMFAYFTNPLLMLIGRFISGAFASGWIVGVTSYINLKSKPDEKIKNFGYQLVATNLGGVVGQMLSGKIGSSNVYYSFIFQITFLIILGLVVFGIVENLYPEAKVQAKTSFTKAVGALREHGYLLLMLSMICFATINNISRGMPSYFGSDVANFTTSQVGNMNAYVNLLGLISNLFIIRIMEKKFTFFTSYLIQGVTTIVGTLLILYAVATIDTNPYFGFLFLTALTLVTLGSSFYRPYVQKEVVNSGKFDQGEILGVINSFNAIGMLLSSGSMTLLYPLNPIMPFVAMLVFAILSVSLHLIASKDEKTA